MKIFRITMTAMAALTMGLTIASCSDANEYGDADTDNPSWVKDYNESLTISHPASLTGTKWVRATGFKKNAYGEEVQGFVESLDFVKEDSVIVIMSQGATEGTWLDESNNENTPKYEYTYADKTGSIAIKKMKKDDKGNLTKQDILVGVAVSGTQEGITMLHYGDTPLQTYLVKQ